jgi:hypothetical protein
MDWIEARIKCSVESASTTLGETIRLDIERWRELKGAGTDSPDVNTEDSSRLIITSAVKNAAGERAARTTVEKKATHIKLTRPAGGDLQFVPRLNAAVQCRLTLGEKELEFWQASRMVLEPILFE